MNKYEEAVKAFLAQPEAYAPVTVFKKTEGFDIDQWISETVPGLTFAIHRLGLTDKVYVGLGVYEQTPIMLMKTPALEIPFKAAIVL